MDVERIGVAYAGDETEVRERGFWKDLGHQGTPYFTLRSSRDGKIVPTQTYEQTTTPITVSAHQNDHGDPAYMNELNWPMPPEPTLTVGKKRAPVPSQASQQTIHVGLRSEPPTIDFAPAIGSVKAGRVRAEYERARSQTQSIKMKQMSREEGLHNVAKFESRLAASENAEKTTIYGQDTAQRKLEISTNQAADIKSNFGSIHSPGLASRDFDPESKRHTHVRRDGYTI